MHFPLHFWYIIQTNPQLIHGSDEAVTLLVHLLHGSCPVFFFLKKKKKLPKILMGNYYIINLREAGKHGTIPIKCNDVECLLMLAAGSNVIRKHGDPVKQHPQKSDPNCLLWFVYVVQGLALLVDVSSKIKIVLMWFHVYIILKPWLPSIFMYVYCIILIDFESTHVLCVTCWQVSSTTFALSNITQLMWACESCGPCCS